MNKNIFLLWQGQLISQLGTQAYLIVMMFWLMDNTGLSVLMSLMLTLSILPNLFFGPIAGVIADQFSRKKIIIVTDLIRGMTVLFLSIMIFSEYANQTLIVVLFTIVSFINGISKAFFQPAIDAFIPDLVATEKLSKTVAFFQSSTQCTNIVGQAIGGVLYRVLGAPVLLFLDAISYFISAFSESFIKHDPKFIERKDNGKIGYEQHKSHLIDGLNYVKGNKGMFQSMLFASSVNFFIAPIMLLLPFYVTEQLLEGSQWYGFLLAAMAFGSIFGYWISARINVDGHRRSAVMFGAMILLSCGVMLLSYSLLPYLSFVALFIVGLSFGIFNLQAMTLFQTKTPTQLRGRVMSLLMTMCSALLPIGLVVSGGLGALTNNDTQFIFSLSSVSISILSIITTFNTDIKSFIFNAEVSDVCVA
ncbi:MFS transporter [Shewanella sp. VB17]|uniref:MFS transporter n=1 Tax=Shewanella sp. VB17 TaxID=2739432 RepID=UPI0015652957|nr:MFS transporter [Shewanella sp. VB17]NRD72504.1 MFS transporter [Shewanella sp. VB17]